MNTENSINLTLTEFLRKLPPVTFIGIMGVCGKSTTFSVAENICKNAKETFGNKFLAIDLRCSHLFDSYLKEIKRDGVVLAKIPIDLLAEFIESGITPTIAVFTLLENAKPYEKMLKKLTYTNYIIGMDDAIDTIKKQIHSPLHARMLRTGISVLPRGAKLPDTAMHIREDVSLAVRVAEIFEIPSSAIVSVISKFTGLEGRLEYVKKVKEVTYINDAHSEHFASLKAAIGAVAQYKNTVLIMGGDDKGFDTEMHIDSIAQFCHTFVVIPGSGTQKMYKYILKMDDVKTVYANSIEESVEKASECAGKGDVIVFSPGFCPTHWCGNREDRSRRFIEAVKKLK